MAAATFANSAYVAMLANAKDSITAAKFLARATAMRTRAEQQLRQRLTRVLTRLCDIMSIDDVLALADYVHAISKH
jgi:hypothetical protein